MGRGNKKFKYLNGCMEAGASLVRASCLVLAAQTLRCWLTCTRALNQVDAEGPDKSGEATRIPLCRYFDPDFFPRYSHAQLTVRIPLSATIDVATKTTASATPTHIPMSTIDAATTPSVTYIPNLLLVLPATVMTRRSTYATPLDFLLCATAREYAVRFDIEPNVLWPDVALSLEVHATPTLGLHVSRLRSSHWFEELDRVPEGHAKKIALQASSFRYQVTFAHGDHDPRVEALSGKTAEIPSGLVSLAAPVITHPGWKTPHFGGPVRQYGLEALRADLVGSGVADAVVRLVHGYYFKTSEYDLDLEDPHRGAERARATHGRPAHKVRAWERNRIPLNLHSDRCTGETARLIHSDAIDRSSFEELNFEFMSARI